MRPLALVLLAQIALAADSPAVRSDVPPLASTQTERIAAARALVEQAFQVAGKGSTGVLLQTPGVKDQLPPGYAVAFGRSVQALPLWFEREGVYQRIVARQAAARAGIDPAAIDAFLFHLDQQAGILLDEISRPDVVLRSFEVYRREQPTSVAK